MSRWALTMHIGRNGKASKTEAMFFPAAGKNYDDADTTPLSVDDGQVPFTKKFTYLGSVVASSLSAEPDVTTRIKKASAVFGALRKCVFGTRDIMIEVKRQVYTTLVLSVLLYGSECWPLTAADKRRIEVFHRKCVRTMTGVSRRKQHKSRVSSAELEEQCELESMDFYLRARALRWAGHLVRMPHDRLSRKLFFGWYHGPRPRGGSMKTYGQRVKKLVKRALELAEPAVRQEITGAARQRKRRKTASAYRKEGCGWIAFAQDRNKWRQLVNAGRRFAKKEATSPGSSSSSSSSSNGTYDDSEFLSAATIAAVEADIARARAMRDR